MLEEQAILHYTTYEFLALYLQIHDRLYVYEYNDVDRLHSSFIKWRSYFTDIWGFVFEGLGDLAIQFRASGDAEKLLLLQSHIEHRASETTQYIWDALVNIPSPEIEVTKSDSLLYYCYIHISVQILRKGISLLEASEFNEIIYWDNAIRTTCGEFITLLLSEGHKLESELSKFAPQQVQETSIGLADYWEKAIYKTVEKFY